MRLFLLRHAQAHETFPDFGRKLTPFGEYQIRLLCDLIDSGCFCNLAQVWHSPYERAKRTAEIFCSEMNISAPLQQVSNITPEDNPRDVARTIASISSFGGDLLIVSHNPFLEALANTLINSQTGGLVFKKCTLAALSNLSSPDSIRPYGLWSTDFLISPSFLSRSQ